MIFTEQHRGEVLIDGKWKTFINDPSHITIKNLIEWELLTLKGQDLYIRCLYFYQLVHLATPFSLKITRRVGKERTFLDEAKFDFINHDYAGKDFDIHKHYKPVLDSEIHYSFQLSNNPSRIDREPIVMVFYHVIPSYTVNELPAHK
jgi:hypothetical protein